ncbi:MAG: phosphoribosylaminoimidazole carboxylase [Microbacteriaceae bacterium]|nr:phosphoribosylaminoimidazole carboxylase [Microbacteriaceae bacterium]
MIIGVIGGGQLARMMIPAAVNLGIELRVLAETDGSSAALAATAVGDYHDLETVLEFVKGVDAVTFDHEHVPQSILRELVARGVHVHPGPDALLYAQDKLQMRQRLAALRVPMPDWARIEDAAALDTFLGEHGGRAVLKTATGGYDGKGVRVVSSSAGAADWLALGQPLLVEELVEFRRELAQLVARRPSGELVAWPVVESIQRDGVCVEVIAPAPSSAGRVADVAFEIAETIAGGLGVTGVLAVELFETTDERLLVNELAMRPHNTGHWTIDGAVTSQFENHLRGVLGLPLGSTATRAPWSVMVNILGGSVDDLNAASVDVLALDAGLKIHLYGKAVKPGRKVGHVNAYGHDLDDVLASAREAVARYEHGPQGAHA